MWARRSRDRKKESKKDKKRAKTNEELRGNRPEFDEFGRLIDYTREKASRTQPADLRRPPHIPIFLLTRTGTSQRRQLETGARPSTRAI